MNSKTKEFVDKIAAARDLVLGKTFKHYKGGVYRVTDISIDCTTGEAMAFYHRIAGPDYDQSYEAFINFSRLVSEFDDIVETSEDIQMPRFTRVRAVPTTEYVEMTNGRF